MRHSISGPSDCLFYFIWIVIIWYIKLHKGWRLANKITRTRKKAVLTLCISARYGVLHLVHVSRGFQRSKAVSPSQGLFLLDGFPQNLETQNFFQTIKRNARSECKLRDPCSDGSAARDDRSMPMYEGPQRTKLFRLLRLVLLSKSWS